MFSSVLVANRGEIACRVIQTVRRMGIRAIAVYSEADRMAPHVLAADESVCIGPPQAGSSYLNTDAIFAAAHQTGAKAIHPGYGFLSENAAFAKMCEEKGIVFIGPTPGQLENFGLKHTARALASANHVPLVPGSDLVPDASSAIEAADHIGYPVMLKSTAGGGGIGMAVCQDAAELAAAYDRIKRLSAHNFADSGIFVEKYIEKARHVEVQIFGDGNGRVIILGDRDCSLQRRNQKVVEETPAPFIPDPVRNALYGAATRLAQAVSYQSAGTIEFIYDPATTQFYFLEVNTRLQVEHTVTEETFGIDLVEWMIQQAAGDFQWDRLPPLQQKGAAIQVRIYAEDPGKNFQPTGGLLTEVRFPSDCRVDKWIDTGTEVTSFYDPLLAKLIVHAQNRTEAVARLKEALTHTDIAGIETNLDYLGDVVALPDFIQGKVHTRLLEGFDYTVNAMDVLAAGISATIQDYPGRTGYWQVGVPPSGPMDSYSFRLGNRALRNAADAAGLEILHGGTVLQFRTATRICITGAPVDARLNDTRIPLWEPVDVHPGDVLSLGSGDPKGQRSYLLVAGGFDVPTYLGSRATFTLGVFGGHGGRSLRTGDVLRYFNSQRTPTGDEADNHSIAIPTMSLPIPEKIRPVFSNHWEIGVLYGPHGAPDFFTDTYMDTFFSTRWEVHYNSDRTGIRLMGPAPGWARADGGEAGLHPSNIHDNAYVVGAVDFTGDMPVILGPDGPSLGGFVCPVTIVTAELWKMGQLRPGDTVQFVGLSEAHAHQLLQQQLRQIQTLQPSTDTFPAIKSHTVDRPSPILAIFPSTDHRPTAVCRRSGDCAILVELGEPVLDIATRFMVHALMLHMEKYSLSGITEITPGIRSLQLQYDSQRMDIQSLLAMVQNAIMILDDIPDVSVPSRIVHLPLSWDDESTRLAIEKYTTTVRPDAPWCPSNIEFIRRINGLNSVDDVKQILFSASYLVMGLGDVYLGAPVATPIDPRHRLVTTKYNPARTWTPENAVGIGGAYLCVYGMEGPGGYQFVGRTLQMWNRFHQTDVFEPGKPWLLRFFDQIRFFPVSHDELLEIRRDFIHGKYTLNVTDTRFSLADHTQMLKQNATEISRFQATQQAAFAAERDEWERTGQAHFSSDPVISTRSESVGVGEGCVGVETPVPGSVWKRTCATGDAVKKGDPLIIMESMKMEIAVPSPCDGTVEDILCNEGEHVPGGGLLLSIRPITQNSTVSEAS